MTDKRYPKVFVNILSAVTYLLLISLFAFKGLKSEGPTHYTCLNKLVLCLSSSWKIYKIFFFYQSI